MVEQSMISAPFAIDGTTSFHTEITCLPAGSMVMTTSAPFTAATELSAIAAPSALACSREAPTKSNAITLSPALTRLAAIGPPMLPSPTNATLAMSNSLRSGVSIGFAKHEFVRADLCEVQRNYLRRNILDPRWRPPRIAVLVDDSRAHAFAKIVAGEHFKRGPIFPHQTFFQRGRSARQPQQF